jgi:hypothetical protein
VSPFRRGGSSLPNQTAGCPIFAFRAKVGGDAANEVRLNAATITDMRPRRDNTVWEGPDFSRATTTPMNTGRVAHPNVVLFNIKMGTLTSSPSASLRKQKFSSPQKGTRTISSDA